MPCPGPHLFLPWRVKAQKFQVNEPSSQDQRPRRQFGMVFKHSFILNDSMAFPCLSFKIVPCAPWPWQSYSPMTWNYPPTAGSSPNTALLEVQPHGSEFFYLPWHPYKRSRRMTSWEGYAISRVLLHRAGRPTRLTRKFPYRHAWLLCLWTQALHKLHGGISVPNTYGCEDRWPQVQTVCCRLCQQVKTRPEWLH